MIQYNVAALEKGADISCGLRLVWDHLAHSEPINIALLGHYGTPTPSSRRSMMLLASTPSASASKLSTSR